MGAAWHWYWGQAEGNVLAVPACAVVAVGLGFLFRDQIGRRAAKWWDHHHGPLAVERHKQALREHRNPELVFHPGTDCPGHTTGRPGRDCVSRVADPA
jgi:hypothetical protein